MRVSKKIGAEKFFQQNPVPSLVYSYSTGTFLVCNIAFEAQYGYPVDDPASLEATRIFPEWDATLLPDEEDLSDEDFLDLREHILQSKKGDSVSVILNGSGITYNGEQCLLISCQNNTEQERQQLQLKRTEQQLDIVQEYAAIGFWTLSQENYKFSCSDSYYKIHGIQTREVDLDYQGLLKNIHPEDVKSFQKEIEHSFHKQTDFEFRYRINHPEGLVQWIHDKANLVKNERTGALYLSGISQDVTTDMEEFRHLKLLESVITNTKDAIMITEAEEQPSGMGHKILFVNEAFTEITGYEAEEVIGKSPKILQGSNTSRKKLDKFRDKLACWEPVETTVINYTKDGREFWNNFSAIPVADKFGWYTHWISVQRDVTEQKKQEQLKKLFSAMAQIFKDYSSLRKALKKSLSKLLEYGNFSFAEVWLPIEGRDKIGRVAHLAGDDQGKIFYAHEWPKQFRLGEGLPGVVWQQNKTIFWPNISQEDAFRRHSAAEESGIYLGLGIPLLHKKKFIGALVLGSSDRRNRLTIFEQTLRELQDFLGAEISRKVLEFEYRNIFNHAPETICVTDLEGRFKRMNPKGVEVLWEGTFNSQGVHLREFLHPEDKPLLDEHLKLLQGNHDTRSFVSRFITPSGEVKWLRWTANKISDLEEIYLSAIDITKTRKLESHLEAAASLSRIGSWEYDLIRNTLFWSKITKEIHEVPEDFKVRREHIIDFFQEEYRERIRGLLEQAMDEPQELTFEMPIITARENRRWVRGIMKSEFIKDRCTRIYGSLQDIHDSKIKDIRLQDLTDNFQGVLFQYKQRADGTDAFPYVSGRAREIWELEPEACMENPQLIWDQIRGGGSYEKVVQSLKESAENLTVWSVIMRILLPSGKTAWHQASGIPRPLPNGDIIWNSLITDVSEEKAQQIRLSRASDIAAIGFWEANSTDSITLSENARAILQLPNDLPVSYQGLIRSVAEPHRITFVKLLRKLIHEGQSFNIELQARRGDQQMCWLQCIGEAEMVKGESIKVFGVIQDITSSKLLQFDRESIFQDRAEILESINDGFFSTDQSGNILYWNEQTSVLMGLSDLNLHGQNFDFSPKGSLLNRFYQALKDTLTLSHQGHAEIYWEETSRWLEVSIFQSERKVSYYLKDVTNRKIAEEKLKISKFRYEMVTKATNDAIWDWDIQNNSMTRGESFVTIFGFKRNMGMEAWKKRIHPEEAPRVLNHLDEVIQDSETSIWNLEYRLLAGDGIYRDVLDRGIIIRDRQGKAIRIVGALSDISQRKKTEKKLKKLNKKLKFRSKELELINEELQQFAFVTSHDLQEPLRMISSFLSLLKRRYQDKLDDRADEYIDYAVDGAKRMRQMILDLLEYSRAGRTEHQAEDISLEDLVTAYKQSRSTTLKYKKGRIEYNDLPMIRGYKVPISQILNNLFDNAIKYSREGVPPVIEFKVEASKKWYHFTVKDNGIGIDEAYFEKIFGIFQRLHTKDEYKGSGVGLSLVKKHLDVMKGDVHVSSELGKGTTFHIRIPRQIKGKRDLMEAP